MTFGATTVLSMSRASPRGVAVLAVVPQHDFAFAAFGNSPQAMALHDQLLLWLLERAAREPGEDPLLHIVERLGGHGLLKLPGYDGDVDAERLGASSRLAPSCSCRPGCRSTLHGMFPPTARVLPRHRRRPCELSTRWWSHDPTRRPRLSERCVSPSPTSPTSLLTGVLVDLI
jgi:hypothetical protein